MLKKLWRDPVWSKVIAGAILAIIGSCATYFWPTVKSFLKSSTAVPNWLFIAVSLGVIVICRLAKLRLKDSVVGQSPKPVFSTSEKSAPQIEIHHQPKVPYEVSEIQHGHVLSTVRIGITNSGSRSLSNCKVYIEKIAPEPPLPGGLPIQLAGAGFTLRHDDPEKLVDVAAHWDHVDKFRFSAPAGGTFYESLSYIESRQPRTIMIKVVAVECQRCASFRIWTDDTKAIHLKFIGYAS